MVASRWIRGGRMATSKLGRTMGVAASWAVLAFASPQALATPPSPAAQAEFQRLHPCPVNDARAGACPGYVIEHVVPLCLGGPDVAYNLRWQTVAEAKMNEVRDTRRCPAARQEGESVTWLAPSGARP